jgi:hypothetical protein
MSGAAMAELIRTLSADGEESLPGWWAGRCADALQTDGLAVTFAPEGAGPELVLASAQFAARLEGLQYTLGEGPTREAVRRGVPCLEPDLLGSGWQWPTFGPAAMDAGVRAVFAFPMRLGPVRIGALTCYRRVPGPLGRQVFLDALALAEALASFVVTVRVPPPGQAGRVVEPGCGSRLSPADRRLRPARDVPQG